MDEFSIVDELSVILMFLNPFLAKLPDEAREGLCRRMALESINRDQSIYKQGEEVPCFFLILSGEISLLYTCVSVTMHAILLLNKHRLAFLGEKKICVV